MIDVLVTSSHFSDNLGVGYALNLQLLLMKIWQLINVELLLIDDLPVGVKCEFYWLVGLVDKFSLFSSGLRSICRFHLFCLLSLCNFAALFLPFRNQDSHACEISLLQIIFILHRCLIF